MNALVAYTINENDFVLKSRTGDVLGKTKDTDHR